MAATKDAMSVFRERYATLAKTQPIERPALSPTPAPHALPLNWQEHLTTASNFLAPKTFSSETIRTRSKLLRAVKTSPQDTHPWLEYLHLLSNDLHRYALANPDDTLQLNKKRQALISLHVLATRCVRRTPQSYSSREYLQIFLNLAKLKEDDSPEDAEPARQVFKQLQIHAIGQSLPEFWDAWAALETRLGHAEKASRFQQRARLCATPAVLDHSSTPSSRPQSVTRPARRAPLRQTTAEMPPRLETTPAPLPSSQSPSETSRVLSSSTRTIPLDVSKISSTPLQTSHVNQIRNTPSVQQHAQSVQSASSHDASGSYGASVQSSKSPDTSLQQRHRSNPLHVADKRPAELSHIRVTRSPEMVRESPAAEPYVPQLHSPDQIYGTDERELERAKEQYPEKRQPLRERPQSLRHRDRDRDQYMAGADHGAAQRRSEQYQEKRQPLQERPQPNRQRDEEREYLAQHEKNRAEYVVSPGVNENNARSHDHKNREFLSPRYGLANHPSSDRSLDSSSDERHPRRQQTTREHVRASPKLSILDKFSAHNVVYVRGRQYLTLGQIGKGGSSKVYKVLSDNMEVMALKRVKISMSSSAHRKMLESYANEIELLKVLKGKPAIVQLHDWDISERMGTIQLLMECGDTDLAQLLAKKKMLDENFRRVYWQQMLEAVDTIHEARIVHGDLKPANFIIVAGRLKLIDFGIAKAIQAEDTTKIVRESQVGTPNYMSPEALVAEDLDYETEDEDENRPANPRRYRVGRASDIWSLGCILYQLVYGHTPFAHIRNTMMKLMSIQDPSYVIRFPEIDNVQLLEVLRGCLQRNPRHRMTIPHLLQHAYICPDRMARRTTSGSATTDLTRAEGRDVRSMASNTIETLRTRRYCVTTKSGEIISLRRGDEHYDRLFDDLCKGYRQDMLYMATPTCTAMTQLNTQTGTRSMGDSHRFNDDSAESP